MSGGPGRIGRAMSAQGWRIGVLRDPGDGGLPLPDSTGPMILKIGGSLLSRPDWPTLLPPLMAACGPRPCCVVVGGGAVVDGLRMLDRAMPQSPELMHHLAIEAMRLTARLVASGTGVAMASAPPVAAGVAVLDVPAWLGVGSRMAALPVGWEVTSDAIAALVAVEHGGSLLLAKSTPPPPCPRDTDLLGLLSRAGWLDGHFPVAAGPLATIAWAAPEPQ